MKLLKKEFVRKTGAQTPEQTTKCWRVVIWSGKYLTSYYSSKRKNQLKGVQYSYLLCPHVNHGVFDPESGTRAILQPL